MHPPMRSARFPALLRNTLFPGIAAALLAGCVHAPPPRHLENAVVEAACGECLFHLPGKGCDLAVRIDGKAYYVEGVPLDSLGDAHAEDGLCKVIRPARVTGVLRGERFHASAFQILPVAAP